jgi:hypothetical protein
VELPKNAPVLARGSDTKTAISVRPAPPRPQAAVTTLPSSQQAMRVNVSSVN